MKVSKKEMLAAVSEAGKFMEHKGNMPVLSYLEMTFGKSDVKIHATDLDTDFVTTVEGESGKNDGTVYIPQRKLMDALKTLRDDEITLEVLKENAQPNACPKCGSEKFEVPEQKSEEENMERPEILWNEVFCEKCGHIGKDKEFYHNDAAYKHLKVGEFFVLPSAPLDGEMPETPQPTGDMTTAFRITAERIAKVLPATTNEEAGFKLSGIYFDDQYALATDGHRLHYLDVAVKESCMLSKEFLASLISRKKPDMTFEFMMEKTYTEPVAIDDTLLNGLKKNQLLSLWEDYFEGDAPTGNMTEIKGKMFEVMEKVQEPAEKVETHRVYLEYGNTRICHRTMEVRFPQYDMFIGEGKMPENSITVDSNLLQEAMEQSLAISNERYRAVKIAFNGCIDMESFNPDVGEFKRVQVPVEAGSIEPQVEGGFNPKYILDVLKLTEKDEKVQIHVGEVDKPIYFTAEKFNALVMPMRV